MDDCSRWEMNPKSSLNVRFSFLPPVSHTLLSHFNNPSLCLKWLKERDFKTFSGRFKTPVTSSIKNCEPFCTYSTLWQYENETLQLAWASLKLFEAFYMIQMTVVLLSYSSTTLKRLSLSSSAFGEQSQCREDHRADCGPAGSW